MSKVTISVEKVALENLDLFFKDLPKLMELVQIPKPGRGLNKTKHNKACKDACLKQFNDDYNACLVKYPDDGTSENILGRAGCCAIVAKLYLKCIHKC